MKHKQDAPVIGWREWLSLPDLGIKTIKAKIDTGARSSSIHAFDIRPYMSKGQRMVRFKIHPYQHDSHKTAEAEAVVMDRRLIRNSGGSAEFRYVIQTTAKIKGYQWPIELTLTNRDVMGFRMLLGRQAIRGRFLINPSKSFLLGHDSQVRKKQKKRDKR